MLMGVERLVDLTGARESGLTGVSIEQVASAVQSGDVATLARSDGHFAAVGRDGQQIRMARTIGIPLRYFVAKMFHGPFLVVGERIDQIFEWCREQKIGWQFDPAYTRMVPAHYLTEIEQIGCPDPAPQYTRFFDPPAGAGSTDVEEIGARYVGAAHKALNRRLAGVPDGEPIGIAFSGGIDSTSVLLMADHALREMGRIGLPSRIYVEFAGVRTRSRRDWLSVHWAWDRAGSGLTFRPANMTSKRQLPLSKTITRWTLSVPLLRFASSRRSASEILASSTCSMEMAGMRILKSYPLDDLNSTLSSILRNPMLYQEGWGIDAIKHSLTYSGGLSRSYVRTYAPAKEWISGFLALIWCARLLQRRLQFPLSRFTGSVERLYSLKQEVVAAGIQTVTGIDMPVHPKRRFQDGVGGESYRRWKVSKGMVPAGVPATVGWAVSRKRGIRKASGFPAT